MSPRSGWCSDYRGLCSSEKAHKVCQMRQDDGHLGPCECERGHTHNDRKEDEPRVVQS